MQTLLLIVQLSLISRTVANFRIVQSALNSAVRDTGESLEMVCRTNDDWEYCKWRHIGSLDGSLRECELEWKRSSNGVRKQECHEDVTHRVTVTGNYLKKECGIRISNLTLQDSGTWECEMEEYVLMGSRGSGNKDTHSFTVQVEPTTVPTTATTITTTTLTTTSTAEESTTEKSTTQSVEDILEYDYGGVVDNGEYNGLPDHAINDDGIENNNEEGLNDDELMYDGDDAPDDLSEYDDSGDIISEELKEPEAGSGVSSKVSLIIGATVGCLLMAILATMVVVYVRRRKGFSEIVSMQKLREEGLLSKSLYATSVDIPTIDMNSIINEK